jgi:hypothetical protein
MRILRIRIPNTACGTSGSKDEGEVPEEAGIDGRGEERGGDGHSHTSGGGGGGAKDCTRTLVQSRVDRPGKTVLSLGKLDTNLSVRSTPY